MCFVIFSNLFLLWPLELVCFASKEATKGRASWAECQLLRVALPRETGERRSGEGVKTIDHSGLCDRKN